MASNNNLINELVNKYGRDRSSLMPILQGVVEQNNYISDMDMTEIAKELDLSAAQVFGTATFYSFLDTVPRGRFVIRVCKTITCDMHGRKMIVQNSLKICLRSRLEKPHKIKNSPSLKPIAWDGVTKGLPC